MKFVNRSKLQAGIKFLETFGPLFSLKLHVNTFL